MSLVRSFVALAAGLFLLAVALTFAPPLKNF